jgi:hypothetical protein
MVVSKRLANIEGVDRRPGGYVEVLHGHRLQITGSGFIRFFPPEGAGISDSERNRDCNPCTLPGP